MFYGYLNPESTKTHLLLDKLLCLFYGYLNPESTKTLRTSFIKRSEFYGYLNPESTKTGTLVKDQFPDVLRLLKS